MAPALKARITVIRPAPSAAGGATEKPAIIAASRRVIGVGAKGFRGSGARENGMVTKIVKYCALAACVAASGGAWGGAWAQATPPAAEDAASPPSARPTDRGCGAGGPAVRCSEERGEVPSERENRD